MKENFIRVSEEASDSGKRPKMEMKLLRSKVGNKMSNPNCKRLEQYQDKIFHSIEDSVRKSVEKVLNEKK